MNAFHSESEGCSPFQFLSEKRSPKLASPPGLAALGETAVQAAHAGPDPPSPVQILLFPKGRGEDGWGRGLLGSLQPMSAS